MKKFLSLVLALAMAMSLVVINTSAAEFTDGEDITYAEAVDVISAIGIVDGYTDGSFNPQGGLTRGAAAKIICNLILGPTTAAELNATTAPYSDVSVNNEFAGYIAYCAQQGIISGYADGTFRPANPLTGYAFMKMLLGALGYDQYTEGYTGDNWSINVAKQAIGIGLNAGLADEFNGVDYVTREEACLYAFNTLQADLVSYDTVITTTINGQTVTIGNSVAKSREWGSSATRRNNIKNDNYVQFAEEYFNRLVLTNTTDAFGRPARDWNFDGSEVGTYVNSTLLRQEYTTEVTGRDLYDLLGRSVIDDYTFVITVDGETEKDILDTAYFTQDNLLRTNTTGVGETGNGVLTQVFVDNDANVETVYISIINTYLAKATDDYDERRDEVTYDVWSVNNKGTSTNPILVKDTDVVTPLTVDGEDFAIEDVQENDIVMVHVAEGEIKEILEPEVMSEVEITSFKNGSWVTADGEQYDYNDAIQYDDEVLDAYDDHNMKDTSYNVYLDTYGYAIGVEIVDEVSQYLFLTGLDGSNTNLSNRNVEANAIFLDGTMDTITVNFRDSEAANGAALTPGALMNTWCKYTVNSNNVYTLTEIADTQATFVNSDGTTDKVGQSANSDTAGTASKTFVTLDKSHVTLDGIATTGYQRVYANDNTVFLTAETDRINAANGTDYIIISDVDSVATGIQNVNLKAWNANAVINDDAAYTGVIGVNTSHGVYTLFDDDGYVIAAVVVGEDDGTTTNYAYVTSDSMNREAYDRENDEYTWSREAIVNGQLVTLTETGSTNPELDHMDRGKWYEVKYYADGTVRRVTEIKVDNGDNTVDSYEFYKGTIAAGNYPKFIGIIDYVEGATDDNDTVVLYEDLTAQPYVISVKGSTLQVDTATAAVSRGFAVSSSANTVLIQDSKTSSGKVTLMDDIYEYTGGTSGLERAIRNLNDNQKFRGYIGAVIENGVATSVVVYDKTHTDIDTGITGGPVQGVAVDLRNPANVVVLNGSGSPVYTDAALSAIVNQLTEDGYTVTSIGYDNTARRYVLNTTRVVGGMTLAQEFWWDGTVTSAIGITLNGEPTLVNASWGLDDLMTDLGVTPVATEFVNVGGTMTATNDTSTLSAGDVINTTLYVQVNVTSAVTATGATTGFASGATATAAAASTMTGYVQKGVAGTYSVEITINTAATDAAVDLTENGGRTLSVTSIAGGTAANTVIPVQVTLSATDTATTVNLAFTVTD